ncbi:MAG: RnfABCDGE type electron transport complex subunit D [Bacteroidota bacterium]|nr:RnfABCDGE type electron transport complex subunit D [Bacteroidota bacterium]
MNKLITVSPSPHMHSGQSTSKLMTHVLIALVPAFGASVWLFGWGALIVTSVAISSCLIFEFLIQKFILKKEISISDGSAAVTGALLAFSLPASTPIGMVMIGSLVAIGIGKMSFGGLGNNPFNPALVGRVFLFISFPVQMTNWPVPKGFETSLIDAITAPTPLEIVKEGMRISENMNTVVSSLPSNMEVFCGKMGGSLGEIAACTIIAGFLYLLITRVISWHIPVSILATVTVFTGIMWLIDPNANANPGFHLLSGGLLLGAIFMATDYVTSPMTHKGMIIFGVGIGLITVIIRRFGAYPEGIQFAILIMNAFVPLINSYLKPKRFGND